MKNIEVLYQDALELLKELIKTPSHSKSEEGSAACLESFLNNHQIPFQRHHNNVWAVNKYFDERKPGILLNSHHDTVLPNSAYTRDPYDARIEDGKLFGLGSNDAGASLVSLLALFRYYYDREDLKYNLIIAASAEEENSGANGITSVMKLLPSFDFAIVGEPTEMHLAIAEKGLMVLDGHAHGVPGHAAREEGDNAIYRAMKDIAWIENYNFDKVSDQLGKVKMTVTQVNAGKQHNVVPALCDFVVDVRTTDCYSNEEILKIINTNTQSEIIARSLRLQPSSINPDHPIVRAGMELGRKTYGSPTLSDQSLIDKPSLKMGPGDSARSHSADEFVYTSEIKEGIGLYIEMLSKIL